jgi:uncharacterized membrane protein
MQAFMAVLLVLFVVAGLGVVVGVGVYLIREFQRERDPFALLMALFVLGVCVPAVVMLAIVCPAW